MYSIEGGAEPDPDYCVPHTTLAVLCNCITWLCAFAMSFFWNIETNQSHKSVCKLSKIDMLFTTSPDNVQKQVLKN